MEVPNHPNRADTTKKKSTDIAQRQGVSTDSYPPFVPEATIGHPASDPCFDSTTREETQRSLALLAAIVESSDDAIISSDLNGRITSWNKGAECIFGYTADEMLGHRTLELASPDYAKDTELVLQKIRHGEKVDHYETVRRHKDGSKIIVSMSVSPIRDAAGNLIGASKVSRDITATRRAEESLRNTDKLAIVGRMAASIAHEINNPLEAVTNLLYLIEQGTISDEARSYLTLAQHELTRVSHIASQTLGFFRNNDRGFGVGPLSDIVDSAISLHLGRLSTSSITVQKEYVQVSPFFLHQGELRQVLVNLIGNALDAMPSGGRLRVRVHHAYDAMTDTFGVRIVVADTGIGMTRATVRKIFEPFYTTKGPSGTGLGLWVSSQIITRHKGRISVRSSQAPSHSGTVFSIYLPHLSEAPLSEMEDNPGFRLQKTAPPTVEPQTTSREDESRHTPSEPDRPSTGYNAA